MSNKESIEFDLENIDQVYLTQPQFEDKLEELSEYENINLSNLNANALNDLVKELVGGESLETDDVVRHLIKVLGRETAQKFIQCHMGSYSDSVGIQALENNKAKWVDDIIQALNEDASKFQYLKSKGVIPAGIVAGSLSRNRKKAHLKVSLYHTGIQITMSPLSPSEFSLLQARIAKDKVKLAKDTYGMRYNINSGASDYAILDTLLSKVTGCNLENWNKDILLAIFDDRDLDKLCIDAVSCHYPKGYNVTLHCSNLVEDKEQNKKRCGHSIDKKMSLLNLPKFNAASIDPKWLQFATSGANKSITLDKLIERNNEEVLNNNTLTIGNMEFEFKTCTVLEKMEQAKEWLTDIENELADTLSNKVSTDDLLSRIDQVTTLEMLRAYIPYIKRYTVYTDKDMQEVESTIDFTQGENQDEAKELLTALSYDDDFQTLLEGIEKFISSNIKVAYGYGNFKCPKCGGSFSNKEENSEIIPIEARRLFFMIMEIKLQMIQMKR